MIQVNLKPLIAGLDSQAAAGEFDEAPLPDPSVCNLEKKSQIPSARGLQEAAAACMPNHARFGHQAIQAKAST